MPQARHASLTCIPMSLQRELHLAAARIAIKENRLNAPHPAALVALSTTMPNVPVQVRIAVVTKKYWRTNGVRLTVGFLDTPPFPLRDKILLHMNAWAKTCNVQFTRTDDLSTAQVRISRGPGGYWSYVGTDILSIAQSQQTMNLEQFTMSTPDSEFYRVVRHEAGHTLGCPHEHMRQELVDKIDPQKAFAFFAETQGWSQQETTEQVLTSIEQSSILGTADPDPNSIMCYQIPGTITKSGEPILGGLNIDDKDYAFMANIYPRPDMPAPHQQNTAVTNTLLSSSGTSAEAQPATEVSSSLQGSTTSTSITPDDTVHVKLTNGTELTLGPSTVADVLERIFAKDAEPAPGGISSAPQWGVQPSTALPSTTSDDLDHANAPASPLHGQVLRATAVPASTAPLASLKSPRVAPGPLSVQGAPTDPIADANVIMTCAIVGHTILRLKSGRAVHYDIEPPAGLDADTAPDMVDYKKNLDAVNRINHALQAVGMGHGSSDSCTVGYTPYWSADGSGRIVGGTGDAALDQKLIYTPPLPTDVAGSTLYKLVKTVYSGPADQKGALPGPNLGYQGRGAYTGFIQGRSSGQTGAFSTYRQVIPPDELRWIPSVTVAGQLPIPAGNCLPNTGDVPPPPGSAYWGMIQSWSSEKSYAEAMNMYLQDQDARRGTAVTATPTTLFGYTHGLIQAIYDVLLWSDQHPGSNPGTPYEIAVGRETVKLASCFACSIFMEANNFPASATHLGRGESWSPLYPEAPKPGVSNPFNNARIKGKTAWEAYCLKILTAALPAVEPNLFHADAGKNAALHASFAQLKRQLTGMSPTGAANLILDALTVHCSENVRINETLTVGQR